MNKNTIIAIVLSTVVVVASIILQSRFMPKTPAKPENQVTENVVADSEKNAEEVSEEIKNFGVKSVNEVTEEKQITVKTSKTEVVLTNKGGDIVSYKLTDHIDVDTKDGVQMVDNVSDFNRACAVALSSKYNAKIVNDLFSFSQPDEKTYLFTKNFVVTDEDGKNHKVTFGKRYTFEDDYMFKLEILFHSDDETEFVYTLRTSPQIGPHFNPKLNRYENRQFISFNGNKAKRQIIGSKPEFKLYNKDYLWNGIGGKYFEEILIPENASSMDYSYYSNIVEVNNYANAQAIVVRKPVKSTDVKDTYYMYFGPRNEKDLKIYNSAEKNVWNLSGLRLTESLNSNGWLGWLETILKWIMEVINKVVHNWGVSIIIMTILIKLAMFPVTKKQSMSTLKMQEIQPKVQAVQNKYKDNPQRMQQEMAKVYQEVGYNPMSGCLPMIVQFLILWSMYNLFNNYFEFRGSSFIPHWIEDLSSGDSLYVFKFNIPFFGNHLRILPFIYLASQLFFGKITNMGGTAGATGSSQAQMKMMMYGMPILFFVLFYNAPSGLLLYWTVSNIFQMIQQIIINKAMKSKKAEISRRKK
ncbi:MAG: membrane protein insertase YidC [Treponema sp.]|jgi:YidC/Oxa1 family membrane protein insertase|nr:membrane protein insertase YidC [Treponema sp.]